eukprot:3122114-Prymnesium_polylepis.1
MGVRVLSQAAAVEHAAHDHLPHDAAAARRQVHVVAARLEARAALDECPRARAAFGEAAGGAAGGSEAVDAGARARECGGGGGARGGGDGTARGRR